MLLLVLFVVLVVQTNAFSDHIKVETSPGHVTLVFPEGTDLTSQLAVSCSHCTLIDDLTGETFAYSGPIYNMYHGFRKVVEEGEERVTWALHRIFPIRHLPFQDFTMHIKGSLIRHGKIQQISGKANVQTHRIPDDFELLYTQVSCDGSEQTTNDAAVTNLETPLRVANDYMQADCYNTDYTEWFGTYSPSRYAHTKTVMNNIETIYNSSNYRISCAGPECISGAIAYVFRSDTSTHTIYLCSQWWVIRTSIGIDSKPGTLVHEFSHFSDIGNTEDHVYGTTNARSIATNSPALAVDNADNYEYFVESGPSDTTCTPLGSIDVSAAIANVAPRAGVLLATGIATLAWLVL
jgi:hypothetical protein